MPLPFCWLRSRLGAEAQAAPPARKTLKVAKHRRFRDHRRRLGGGVEQGRVGAAGAAGREAARGQDAGQGAAFGQGPLLPDARRRPRGDRDDGRGLCRPVEGRRVRGLPLAGRKDAALFRVRDFAAGSRAANSGAQFPGQVLRLAAVALRRRPQDQEGHQRAGRHKDLGQPGYRLDRRVLHSLRPADAAGERAAQAGHDLAGQLLPHGLRRRADRLVGLVPRRPQLPRHPELRHLASNRHPDSSWTEIDAKSQRRGSAKRKQKR